MRPLRTIALVSALAATSAFAWHDSGHMVVSSIAYRLLNKNAKVAVDNLCKTGGSPTTNTFLTAGCWPDDIRRFGNDRQYDKWHYIDLPFFDGVVTSTFAVDKENAVWAINQCIATLKNPKANPNDKARMLRFLIHIVADIHMPLHCESRITKAHPKGDRGGNDFHIPFGGRNSNLHYYWDVAGGMLKECDRPLSPENSKYIAQMASDLAAKHGSLAKKSAAQLDPMAWAREGFSIVKSFCYKTPENAAPSAAYQTGTARICSERLTIAGYRLAAILNGIYAVKRPTGR